MAPGPPPAGGGGSPDLCATPDEDLSYLAGDWRIFQPKSGHRWSLDDLVTAYVAVEQVTLAPEEEAIDLGCGLGSVLMLVAWANPQCKVHGVEAQAARAVRARRSLRYNGADHRCLVVEADLRDIETWRGLVATEPKLVTGTPPYFDLGATKLSNDREAAACRAEVRGGLEVYLDAGAALLSGTGSLVLCYPTSSAERAQLAAQERGMALVSRLAIIPAAGKPSLIVVDRFQRASEEPPPEREPSFAELVVRDGKGHWTETFRRVRRRFGMPDAPPHAAARE